MTDRINETRPVAITITQILMGITLLPITGGLIFSLFRVLARDPLGLLSVRSLIFFGISFGLMIVFLGFGFGGLWWRKKYGYWLGLIFLGAAIAANIFTLAPKLYSLVAVASSTYRSNDMMILDLTVQSAMLGLLILLFLKLSFGKREKLFFSPQLHAD
jgi:hypothetical protein